MALKLPKPPKRPKASATVKVWENHKRKIAEHKKKVTAVIAKNKKKKADKEAAKKRKQALMNATKR